MKTKMILGLSTLALSLSAQATDYKKCNKVLNPFEGQFEESRIPGSMMSSGSFGSGFGLGINPYSIEADGKVKTSKGIKSYKHDKKKNQEIIEYEVATFPYTMEPGEQVDWSKYKPVMKVQKVVIQRDDKNEISKITNDFNVKQEEIDKHNKMMKKWYEYTYSDKYKKEMKKMQEQWGLKDFQAPIMMPLKSDIHLSIVDGECKIDKKTTTHLLENDVKNGHKHESVDFDTKLCKELGTVVKKHQDKLKKCFSDDAAKDLSKLAKNFYDRTGRENPMQNFGFGFGGFGMGMGTFPGAGGGIGMGGGFGMGYPGYGFMFQLENQVANLAFQNPYSSSPPLVQANQMLEMCKMQGLTIFEDEKFWPKVEINPYQNGNLGPGFNTGGWNTTGW
jgi:hypothetical protein